MRKYRTLVRGRLSTSTPKVMEAVIPAWNPHVTIKIPKERLPSFVWTALITGSKHFHARMNLSPNYAEGKRDVLDWLEPCFWEVGPKKRENETDTML